MYTTIEQVYESFNSYDQAHNAFQAGEIPECVMDELDKDTFARRKAQQEAGLKVAGKIELPPANKPTKVTPYQETKRYIIQEMKDKIESCRPTLLGVSSALFMFNLISEEEQFTLDSRLPDEEETPNKAKLITLVSKLSEERAEKLLDRLIVKQGESLIPAFISPATDKRWYPKKENPLSDSGDKMYVSIEKGMIGYEAESHAYLSKSDLHIYVPNVAILKDTTVERLNKEGWEIPKGSTLAYYMDALNLEGLLNDHSIPLSMEDVDIILI